MPKYNKYIKLTFNPVHIDNFAKTKVEFSYFSNRFWQSTTKISKIFDFDLKAIRNKERIKCTIREFLYIFRRINKT